MLGKQQNLVCVCDFVTRMSLEKWAYSTVEQSSKMNLICILQFHSVCRLWLVSLPANQDSTPCFGVKRANHVLTCSSFNSVESFITPRQFNCVSECQLGPHQMWETHYPSRSESAQPAALLSCQDRVSACLQSAPLTPAVRHCLRTSVATQGGLGKEV